MPLLGVTPSIGYKFFLTESRIERRAGAWSTVSSMLEGGGSSSGIPSANELRSTCMALHRAFGYGSCQPSSAAFTKLITAREYSLQALLISSIHIHLLSCFRLISNYVDSAH